MSGTTDAMYALGWLLTGLSVVMAAAALVSRRRRAHGIERQQLNWVTLAATIAGTIIALTVGSYFLSVSGVNEARDVALAFAVMAFPAAIGVAILRFRLYDIDLLLNRTLVYGSLTATLAGTYTGTVLLMQLMLSRLTEGSGLAVAGSTLAVAALFRPVRARIQKLVDRRFFRSRYDATQRSGRSAHGFATRSSSAPFVLICWTLCTTVQPSHASLWLRSETD